MWGTVQHDGKVFKPFKILNGVKQCCVLVPKLFGIFFLLLLKQVLAQRKKVYTCIHELTENCSTPLV